MTGAVQLARDRVWRVACGGWVQLHLNVRRGVAQPGRALGSGPRGRWFESSRPDQSNQQAQAGSSRGLFIRGNETASARSRKPRDGQGPSSRCLLGDLIVRASGSASAVVLRWIARRAEPLGPRSRYRWGTVSSVGRHDRRSGVGMVAGRPVDSAPARAERIPGFGVLAVGAARQLRVGLLIAVDASASSPCVATPLVWALVADDASSRRAPAARPPSRCVRTVLRRRDHRHR